MSIITAKRTFTKINPEDKETQTYILPFISDNCKITDTRNLKAFKDQAFGGYNLTQAGNALEKSILEDKIEPALHWCLQLFFSGIVGNLWSKLITIATKNINIYNPKLPEFIYNKSEQWNKIVDNPKFAKDNVLLLRNHPSVRLLLAEMVATLVLSKKHKIPTLPKIKKEDFLLEKFRARLETNNNNLVKGIEKDEDPSEIRIAINEMAYHIYAKNLNKAVYWLNWVLEWEKINSKKYGKYECATRVVDGIDSKYNKDVIWLIWSVVHKMRQLMITPGMGQWELQIDALWKLYKYKFTPAARAKKLNFLIWTIMYLTETVDYAIPLIDRPEILFQSMLGFDKVAASLKSQQVVSAVNPDIMNVVVENNYMMPERYKEMEEEARRKKITQLMIDREKLAKQKKINVNSMDKLEQVSKMDKYLFS